MDVLERGDITFVYRPRVETPLVHGLGDVQCFYLLLRPAARDHARRVLMGKKRLPAPGNPRSRFWAYVERVGTPEDVTVDLEGGDYQTKTRGRRHQPPARPAGSGAYALIRHEDHTHLSYALELPEEVGPVQRTLGLCDRASYIVAVMNPLRRRPSEAEPSRRRSLVRPHFPELLQWRFEARRFAPVDPPDFLDWPGAELVVIGSKGTERCAGIDRLHTPEEVLARLQLPRSAMLRRPLVSGQWS